MPLGNQDQTCAEAIKKCFEKFKQPLSFSRIVKEVRQQGQWKVRTIWLHLMSTVVNLIPARHEWPNRRPFLFLRPDGRYELYNPEKHPKPVE